VTLGIKNYIVRQLGLKLFFAQYLLQELVSSLVWHFHAWLISTLVGRFSLQSFFVCTKLMCEVFFHECRIKAIVPCLSILQKTFQFA